MDSAPLHCDVRTRLEGTSNGSNNEPDQTYSVKILWGGSQDYRDFIEQTGMCASRIRAKYAQISRGFSDVKYDLCVTDRNTIFLGPARKMFG